MKNIVKTENYEKLLETIGDILANIPNQEWEIEGPYGAKKIFKVKSMSIGIISKVEKQYLINNYSIDKIETITDKSMLIRIWIKNRYKTIQIMIKNENDVVTLDPENFRIYFHQNIAVWINEAFREFFSSEKKESKFSWRTNDPAETYIEKFRVAADISDETIQAAKKMNHRIHAKIQEVREANTNISKSVSVFLFADTEGRRILTKKNDFFSIDTAIKLINKQNYEIVTSASAYTKTEKELQKKIKKTFTKMQKTVKEYEKIHQLETGWYPILMHPDGVHTYLHEGIAGHSLSGKYIVDEEAMVFQSLDKDYSLDSRFEMLKLLKIENKPNLSDTIATYTFDHEGIRAKDTILMDRGKVVDYLTDRNSAYRLGRKTSNGSSLTAAFTRKKEKDDTDNDDDSEIIITEPEPRISNLICTSYSKKSEKQLRKDLIKFCKKENREFYLEIWAKEGEVNIKDSIFNMTIEKCDIVDIHDGSCKRVHGGILAGNLFEFIATIHGISKEMEVDNGLCDARSGYVPIHGKTPYISFSKLHFIATKKPERKNMKLNPKFVP
ncbi:MAG: metallopeptidase TldD-related protein [Candidatus Absconditabacterales bacterium]|jgi:hypothetical protein